MYDVISQQEDHGVVLVATGALTNVALLLLMFPEVKTKLTQIVLMGGAMGIGNTGPVAEFNIQVGWTLSFSSSSSSWRRKMRMKESVLGFFIGPEMTVPFPVVVRPRSSQDCF